MRLQSLLHMSRGSDQVFPPLPRRAYMSLSEPVLPHPVTSSRASSKEKPGLEHRIRLLRPDGATGSGSLRAPSTIRATSTRLDHRGLAVYSQSAPLLQRPSSDSEPETIRVHMVPPNSPMQDFVNEDHICSSSPYKTRIDQNTAAAVHLFDKMNSELSNSLSEVSCILTSAVGSGLDSDFGASAGVSLRILSADSDGLSNGVLASALEWDYYDPCYVKQNHIPRQKHPRPVMHTKQYWV